MKALYPVFAASVLLLALPAFADLDSQQLSSQSASCSVPQVDNIMLSAYAPGCSNDAGTDAATPGGLKPSKFQLDGQANQVVLAAAPMRMPACASKCYKFAGGKPDDGQGAALLSALNQKTFYFDDLCPGCKPGVHKGSKKARGARIDISMSCGKSKNFRVLNATLRPVPCTDQVMAEIEKNGTGGTQVAKSAAANRQMASVPAEAGK